MAVGSFMHLGNFNFHSIHAGLRANKVYVLNKQVSKYMVMVFFSSKINVVSLVPTTGYGFVLPCVYSVYLSLLGHSTSDCVSRVLTIETVVMLTCKNHALLLWYSFLA